MTKPHLRGTMRAEDMVEVVVDAVTDAAEGVKIYEMRRLDGRTLPPVPAGSHIDVHLANGITRQYSLLQSHFQPHSYRIAVKREVNGRGGSQFIHDQMHVGATLSIGKPRNNFPLEEEASCSVFFAGGIGITPIYSMMHRLRELGGRWQLYYCSQSSRQALFLEELSLYAEVTLHFDDLEGGQTFDFRKVVNRIPTDAHIYCCGPTPMLTAFEGIVAARWRPERVHIERFSGTAPALEQDSGFLIHLARSNTELYVHPSVTILGTLRTAGFNVPYSCENGVCGTCEVRVLDGIPDHRDAVLSREERQANDRLMICCSRCRGDRMVLDL